MKVKEYTIEVLETVLTSLIVLFIIYSTIAMPEQVMGASMESTFFTGERILVERLTKHIKPFQRGDIVVLNPPGNNSVDYIKRIIGVPGDVIKVFNCKVYVSKDGQKYELEEPYLSQGMCTSDGPQLTEGRALKLNDGEYIVLGDNRDKSADSRFFGVITADRIVGRVVFRFWPLDRFGFVS